MVETRDLGESVGLVLSGKVDALVDYHLVVENFILENSIVGLLGLPQKYLNAASIHYLSHLEKPILHSILQKALNSITKEEKYKLYQQWFSQVYRETANHIITSREKEFLEKHPVIRFKVRPDQAPFEFEKDGKALGIAVDYIKKSAENIGLNVKFVIDNDTLKESENIINGNRSKYDTLLYVVKSANNEQIFSFGKSYLSYPIMIITHKDAPYIDSVKSLSGKSIVLEEGIFINQKIKKEYPDIKINIVKNAKDALEMINNKKALAYIGNLGIANYMSLFGDMDNLKIAAPTNFDDIKYSFVAPQKWPELSSLLTKGYDKISPAEHSSIQQKWFSLQTISKEDYSLMLKILIGLFVAIIWILWWNRKLTVEKDKTKLALENLQKVKDQLEEKNKEVYESQKFLQSIIDENPNPIIIKNYEGKFLLVNEALAKLYKTTKENMIGKDDGDFIDDKKMVDYFKKSVKEIFDKKETTIVYEDTKDMNTGKTKHYMSIKKPFISIDGQKAVLIIANDITQIKRLEQERLKNQEILFSQSKIAAMGEMICNIAHQWRQPLSIISTSATGLILEKQVDALSDEKLYKSLNSINDYAQYLSTTIDIFRDYTSVEKEHKEVVIQDRIKVALRIVESTFTNSYISIISNIDEVKPIKAKLVIGELSEVIINILNNARDIILEKKIKKPWVKIDLKQIDNRAIISIEDNAGGIPEEILPKIFDPYFTTKHKSQGTGLGLHMSYKIITESLNGEIHVVNTKNGAKFTIDLPLVFETENNIF